MDVLDQVKAFVRVVESGSFTATAGELGVGQPAISRAVGALEARLGVRLLHRSTRGLSLTEEGERAYERALRVLEDVEALDGSRTTTPGRRRRIRVACPMAFGTLRLVSLVTEFTREHRDVEIDLRLTDSFVDLVEEGIDVAFRFGALADSAHVARKIGMLPRIVVASREYLRRCGTPKRLEDLASHECVVRGTQARDERWTFRTPQGERTIKVGGAVRVDNFLALREAVLAGAGIGLGGTVVFYEGRRLHPSLRRVLVPFALPSLPFHVVFRGDRFLPTRVRTFVDRFVEVARKEPWLET